MRLFSSRFILAFAALACFVNAEDVTEDPELSVTASFPGDNPFGQVVNGERNRLNLLVENKSDHNSTLISIAGSFHDVQTDALIKNTTALQYGLRLISGTKLQVPYQFHSEFKPGDVRLNIWLTHSVDDTVYRVVAYDSVVPIVEPEVSFFDYQVITTYLLTAAFLGGLSYFAFKTFTPKVKKSRRSVASSGGKDSISSPVGSVTASAGGYDEQWIPSYHFKKDGKRRTGPVSSGDDVSGGETSGTEGKKRRGRK
ncbi:hypothetical protein DFH11DRAFT_1723786 [Phellopilus nigrolimitatus]|nr:hypothetical protein DFH11DRAFT_1723786 [Phellopilus nigrolimitatus]